MPEEVSQEELREVIRGVQDGSPEAFQTLYALFSKRIYNFIWRLIGSTEDAEDLTQDTFLKVHSELKSLRDPEQFKFWLYRIARNEVYQKLRKSQRTTEVSIDEDDFFLPRLVAEDTLDLDPERRFLAHELNGIVQRALESMSPKYRDVFVLAVFQKMKYDDIAEIVGRSLLSVKTDIYRARLIVKDYIKTYLKRQT